MSVRFSDVFPLSPSRTHEVTGAGAVAFAAIAAGMAKGSVIWLAEGWAHEQLNPLGLLSYCDPHRLLFARPSNMIDLLAVTEDALRDGSVPIVIAEITKPLSLTTGRRLQLAAKAGGATGIMIIPDDGMGSNAAQTRWRVTPQFHATDSTLMRWDVIKNKSGTLTSWNVAWDEQTHRIRVVQETAKRPHVAADAL